MNMGAWRKHVLVGIVAGMICALPPLSSRASTTACGSERITAPVDGETDVPTNTRLWGFTINAETSTRLIGPDGPVPLTQSYIPIATAPPLPVLTPESALRRNTKYRIEVELTAHVNSRRAPEVTEFFTGRDAEEQRPQPLELWSNEAGFEQGWSGISRWRKLQFSHGPLIIGDLDAALGDVTSLEDLAIVTENLDFFAMNPELPGAWWMTSRPTIMAGSGDCLAWPAGTDVVSARFGVLDLAGNFSGWFEIPLSIPSRDEATAFAARAAAAERGLPDPSERDSHGDGHLTGCALARGTAPRAPTSMTIVAVALGLSRLRRRARVKS